MRKKGCGFLLGLGFFPLSLAAVPFHLPGGGLNFFYNDDPDAFAAPAVALKGPCGHAYPGYLLLFNPAGFRTDEAKIIIDRNQLIPLPEPSSAAKSMVPPGAVAPFPQPTSVLETASGNGDGTLNTQNTSDAITWGASSSPAEEPIVPLLPPFPQAPTLPSVPLESIPESIPLPRAPVAPMPQTLPTQLLYFFQQPLQAGKNSNTIVVPFEVPLQSQALQSPPASRSTSTLITE